MNTIPPITDPLGRSWKQPSTSLIDIDDTHALMTCETFEQLAEYSASQPSGVYPGKMWRRHNGKFDDRCKPEDWHWLLCWYDFSDRGPEWCSTKFREILLIEPVMKASNDMSAEYKCPQCSRDLYRHQAVIPIVGQCKGCEGVLRLVGDQYVSWTTWLRIRPLALQLLGGRTNG